MAATYCEWRQRLRQPPIVAIQHMLPIHEWTQTGEAVKAQYKKGGSRPPSDLRLQESASIPLQGQHSRF